MSFLKYFLLGLAILPSVVSIYRLYKDGFNFRKHKLECLVIGCTILLITINHVLNENQAIQEKRQIKLVKANVTVELSGQWETPPFSDMDNYPDFANNIPFLTLHRFQEKEVLSPLYGKGSRYKFDFHGANIVTFRVELINRIDDPLLGRDISELSEVSFGYLIVPIVRPRLKNKTFEVRKIQILFNFGDKLTGEYTDLPPKGSTISWSKHEPYFLPINLNGFKTKLTLNGPD